MRARFSTGDVSETTIKAVPSAESPKILPELLHPVMDRNPAFRQQRLKGELAHLRQTLACARVNRSCWNSVNASSRFSSGALVNGILSTDILPPLAPRHFTCRALGCQP